MIHISPLHMEDLLNPVETKSNPPYSEILSSYRAVNTLRLGYKDQSVNVV